MQDYLVLGVASGLQESPELLAKATKEHGPLHKQLSDRDLRELADVMRFVVLSSTRTRQS